MRRDRDLIAKSSVCTERSVQTQKHRDCLEKESFKRGENSVLLLNQHVDLRREKNHYRSSAMTIVVRGLSVAFQRR